MSLYHIDTSAAIKLIVAETHSKAFATFFDEHGTSDWVSSALLRVENSRAVKRAAPTAAPETRELLMAFGFVNIDDEIIDAAMTEADPALRSLDAIHLATARAFGADLTGLATYDDRLTTAATNAGITVISPRD